MASRPPAGGVRGRQGPAPINRQTSRPRPISLTPPFASAIVKPRRLTLRVARRLHPTGALARPRWKQLADGLRVRQRHTPINRWTSRSRPAGPHTHQSADSASVPDIFDATVCFSNIKDPPPDSSVARRLHPAGARARPRWKQLACRPSVRALQGPAATSRRTPASPPGRAPCASTLGLYTDARQGSAPTRRRSPRPCPTSSMSLIALATMKTHRPTLRVALEASHVDRIPLPTVTNELCYNNSENPPPDSPSHSEARMLLSGG